MHIIVILTWLLFIAKEKLILEINVYLSQKLPKLLVMNYCCTIPIRIFNDIPTDLSVSSQKASIKKKFFN